MRSRPAVSPEFRLAAACAHWPPGPEREARLRDALDGALDWGVFRKVVTRHRILGFAYTALSPLTVSGVPADVLADLHRHYRRQVQKNLRQISQAAALHQALEQAGVPAMFLKGPGLSMLAYDDPGIRHSRDIDVLVMPEQFPLAREVLHDLGYREPEPMETMSPRQRRILTSAVHELEFFPVFPGSLVELHGRLSENPALMRLPMVERWRMQTLGNVSLPGLAGADLFLYLCVHGARHAWFRLKWLADIAALARSGRAGSLDALCAHACEQDLLRPVAQGLMLASDLLGLDLPAEMRAGFRSDSRIAKLVDVAWSALIAQDGFSTPTSQPFAMTRVKLSHWYLKSDWAYRRHEIRRHWVSPEDRLALSLPPMWEFLYPILRVPLWLKRKIGW